MGCLRAASIQPDNAEKGSVGQGGDVDNDRLDWSVAYDRSSVAGRSSTLNGRCDVQSPHAEQGSLWVLAWALGAA
jgi:hypothetical protein